MENNRETEYKNTHLPTTQSLTSVWASCHIRCRFSSILLQFGVETLHIFGWAYS